MPYFLAVLCWTLLTVLVYAILYLLCRKVFDDTEKVMNLARKANVGLTEERLEAMEKILKEMNKEKAVRIAAFTTALLVILIVVLFLGV